MVTDAILKVNRSSRAAFLAALVLIAAAGLYRWIFAPFNSRLFAVQQSRDVTENRARRAGIITATVEAATRKVQEQQERIDGLRETLFTPGELTDMLTIVQSMAAKTGCVIRSFTFVPQQRGDGSQEGAYAVPINSKKANISVVGGYSTIVAMLNEVCNYPKKIWIDSLRVYPVEANLSRLRCDVSITIYSIGDLEAAFNE